MLLKIIYLFSRLNLPFTICQTINKARSLTVDLAGGGQRFEIYHARQNMGLFEKCKFGIKRSFRSHFRCIVQ